MPEHYLIVKDELAIPTELAITSSEQERGLMYRDKIKKAMSFLYPRPAINKFWMRNTKIPLDIIFCYRNKIIQIAHGEPFSLKLIGNEQPSDLVIELPYQFCQDNQIKLGDEIDLFLAQDRT